MAHLTEVTDNDFESQVLKSSTPVLVDFWAVWCGPCKMIAPIVEELAGEYEGRLKVVKLDVDENIKTATQFGIRSIPSLVIFKGGTEVDRIIGTAPKRHLAAKIEAVLAA
ncbi:MAG: thioredoxin [Candidatus Latescibacteria bacterium]|nr:thioredoxin [Candidatus Latescibacterota bacterium]